MNITEFYTNDKEAKRLVKMVFPEFKGNDIRVETFSGPMQLPSYWDEGSRDYWVIINLETNKFKQIPENGTPYSNNGKIFRISKLPPNFAVIGYHIGRVSYVTIYLNQENLSKMLPQNTEELSWEQKVVLTAIRSLKSSYAGISDYRLYSATKETGITPEEYNKAKQELISKGLLNKAGAITLTGRNAIGNTDLHSLKRT